MKVVLQRRAERERAASRQLSDQLWINSREVRLVDYTNAERKAAEDMKNRAATKICAMGRGKLGRMEAAELRAMYWAALVFQKWTRGAFGRKR